ncbi:unnamed protein product [Linum trigynum]|uniref:Secreted protein n=1 Tax=Linum trigynum TaxID=586398 RepID=A0AAV2DYD3_9ROSI
MRTGGRVTNLVVTSSLLESAHRQAFQTPQNEDEEDNKVKSKAHGRGVLTWPKRYANCSQWLTGRPPTSSKRI